MTKNKINNTPDYYEITLAKETACLMLKKGMELIDTHFINQMEFVSMTYESLVNEVKIFASKNNLTEYAINLN